MTRRLFSRFAATAAALTAAVTAIRLGYENPDTAHVIAAGTCACAFLAAFSLLLSAGLSYGWHAGRERAAARYEARLNAEHPLGPIRELGYRVQTDEPNVLFEEAGPWRPTVAAEQAADTADDDAPRGAWLDWDDFDVVAEAARVSEVAA